MINQPLNIVLADDHAMVRESLARVLNSIPQLSVVGQAGNGLELIELVEKHRPDCVVMDYSMPDHQPLECIQRFRDRYPNLKIIVLTVHENVHFVKRVIKAGAHAYLIKAAAVDELIDALETVRDGNLFISRQLAVDAWRLLRQKTDEKSGIDSLSDRELDVLKLLAEGNTLGECAQHLSIKVSTVSTYRSRILQKLSLQSNTDLVRFALEHGIIV